VIHVVTRGIERLAGENIVLRVQAGEPWDDLVAFTVEQGLAGMEALAGIPGSCGAAPIQNIGAYGQELSSSLISIEFLDYLSGELLRLPAAELELGYRRSALKGGRAGIVVSIDVALSQNDGGLSDPIE
jgi:UDP-N-acetylmuramate dehydrogenase